MSLACGHTPANRGVISVPVGRKFAIIAPVDCAVSINTTGDAILGSVIPALMKAGLTYICYVPAASGAVFLSGITTDPNGDVTPTQLTFIDSGASGI